MPNKTYILASLFFVTLILLTLSVVKINTAPLTDLSSIERSRVEKLQPKTEYSQDIQAEIEVSNEEGTAPASILFSAAESSSSSDIVRWEWDFGDSNSQNNKIEEGMLALHIFDRPGEYTVKLTVTDSEGSKATTSQKITVSEFTGEAYYVSSSEGNDDNIGTIQSPFRTLEKAFSAQSDSPIKILLNKGDKWNIDSVITAEEDTIIDSYGNGEFPSIEMDSSAFLVLNRGSKLSNIHLSHSDQHDEQLVEVVGPGVTLSNVKLENGGIVATLQESGLVIDNSQISYSNGQGLFAAGDNIAIRNSKFKGSGTDNTYHHQVYLSSGETINGIYDGKNWLVQNSVFDGEGGENNFGVKINGGKNVLIQKSEVLNTRNGFGITTNSEEVEYGLADNIIIDSSLSHDNGNEHQSSGIFLWGVKDVKIANSVFYNNDLDESDQGVIDMMGDNMGDEAEIVIQNNLFYDNALPAIMSRDSNYRVIFLDNLIYGSFDEIPLLEQSGNIIKSNVDVTLNEAFSELKNLLPGSAISVVEYPNEINKTSIQGTEDKTDYSEDNTASHSLDGSEQTPDAENQEDREDDSDSSQHSKPITIYLPNNKDEKEETTREIVIGSESNPIILRYSNLENENRFSPMLSVVHLIGIGTSALLTLILAILFTIALLNKKRAISS